MKITTIKCPHCNATLKVDVEGGAGTTEDFGQPMHYRCRRCRGRVSNGLKEWKDISLPTKVIAVFRTIYTTAFFSAIGAFAGAIIIELWFYKDSSTNEEFGSLIFKSFLVSTVIFGIIFISKLVKNINDSNDRVQSRL